MKKTQRIVATIGLAAAIIVGGQAYGESQYQAGADSGASDLCQELGFTPDGTGACDTGEK